MSLSNTSHGAHKIAEMLRGKKSIFFVGIGGIHMSSLAHIAHLRGFSVGGSDRSRTHITNAVGDSGITVYYSHSAENVVGYDALVYTVAIDADNPEYKYAVEHNIPVISRADFLGYVMCDYTARIGVSGTHGKSTTTSMLAHIYISAKRDPTVVSGAELDEMGGAYRIGSRDCIIFESCEYMDNFLAFYPSVAVVLNEEYDHADYYPDIAAVRRSFTKFMKKSDGVAVVNADDANVRLSAEGLTNTVTFGIDDENADFRAVDITHGSDYTSFNAISGGKVVASLKTKLYGKHNIYDALAAFAVAYRDGISPAVIASALSDFTGAKRRMEYKGTLCGASLYEDYAHHPTEITATLSGAANIDKGRLWCVFQPHTYSRTKEFFDGFVEALKVADRVVLADIYAARETDTLGVSSDMIAEKVGEKAVCMHDFASIAALLRANVEEGDTVIIMGAGDIYKVTEMLTGKPE